MATSTKALRTCAILATLCLCARESRSQINALTFPEAEAILEEAPSVLAARARGECPAFQLNNERQRRFEVAAVTLCNRPGFEGSATIGHYEVDRATGSVEMSEREPGKMVALSKDLVERARARLLTAGEMACLARQAGTGLFGSGAKGEPSVRADGSANVASFETEFTATLVDGSGNEASMDLAVNSSTLTVRDRGTSRVLATEELGRLISDMRSVRFGPSLSSGDALRIALKCPSLTSQMSGGCPRLRADSFESTPGAVFVWRIETCPPAPDHDRLVAAVSVQTGSVVDPRNGKSLDSPESSLLARELLQRAEERLASARSHIDDACR